MSTVAGISAERIELELADGTTMLADTARPAVMTASTPGILVFQDAYGLTPFLRDVLVRFASLGFLAIAPQLYHRTNAIEITYDDVEMIQTRPHQRAINPGDMLADTQAAYTWLMTARVQADRVGAIGFCMGGRLAYLANAHLPLACAISYYGGGVQKFLDLAGKQHGPLLMLWGGQDEHIPNEQHWEVARALTAVGARHEQAFFSRAKHGFFCHVRPRLYDAGVSRKAWFLTCETLREAGILPTPAVDDLPHGRITDRVSG